MASKDTLYSKLTSDVENFVFDQRVVSVFGDMIRRSVPGYATAIAMTGVVAGETAQPGSRIYDLGCSLGTSLISVGKQVDETCELIGIDNSPSMIGQCRENTASLKQTVVLGCADVQDVEISNASVVVLNYTLQFVPRNQRLALLQKIYMGLLPGGVLILSEKIAFEDPAKQTRMDALHHAFKRRNGYSTLEIANKRSALEEVLVADTEAAHIERLAQAGFKTADVWSQCLNFYSFLADK